MKNVHLTMIDKRSGKTVERAIDITNAMSSGNECWELRGVEDQRKNLERWIAERGNEQHNMALELKTWWIG